MPNCYVCGTSIPTDRRKLRKKVKTGEWVRKAYAGNRVQAVQSHFGMRIVCRRCSIRIERREFRDEMWRHFSVFAWLLGLVLFVWLVR